MTDLTDLQDRLNSDEELKAAFLANPVEVFSKEGIALSPDDEKSLQEGIEKAKQQLYSNPAPEGAASAAAAKPVTTGVINVTAGPGKPTINTGISVTFGGGK